MTLNTTRWKGIRRGNLVIVGENGGRAINNLDILTSKGGRRSVNVNLSGLPCGLYWLQLVHGNTRSDTRAWAVAANRVVRLLIAGPQPPLGESPL